MSISDQERASWTTEASNPHYLTDFVTVSNGGATANLVNITVTLTWVDLGAATTSDYVEASSDSRCAEVKDTPRTLSCTAPKSLGPNEFATFGPLIFQTASNTAVTDTKLTATVTAKEGGVAKQGKNPPIATIETWNATHYEMSIDDDVSWAGGGANGIGVTLATSALVGNQFSRMPLPKTMPAGFATLTEEDCPSGSTTCTGQKVSTTAVGLSPLNLQITFVGNLPNGTQEADIVLLHTRSGDSSPTTISQNCTAAPGGSLGDLFSGVVPNNIPCRRVKITHGVAPGGVVRVEIDAWDISNGDWTWG